MAEAIPSTSALRSPEFRTNLPWDAEALNRQWVHKILAEATLGTEWLRPQALLWWVTGERFMERCSR